MQPLRTFLDSLTEDSPSGLWRALGKRVGSNPSRVQIPHPPRAGNAYSVIPT